MRPRSVLIVGMGGLGCPAAMVLGRAGLDHLRIADPDRVEASNLNRQILFRPEHIGRPKVHVAAVELRRDYPSLRVEPVLERVDRGNALALFAQVDFVIDATDGASSKFLLNDAAVLAGKPLSHAGILGLFGQTMTIVPGRTACLRCVFPTPPNEIDVPTCQSAGIVGPLAGAIAAVQAAEALRVLDGEPPRYGDRMLSWDVRRWRWHCVSLRRRQTCPVCGSQPTITNLENLGSPEPCSSM